MDYEDVIEIPNGVSEQVREMIKTAGVRGLSAEKAKEYGVFDRISYLLCTMHACVATAYRIYGGVDYLLTNLGAKKHEIKKACNDFENAFDKFIGFWRQGGYQSAAGIKEMNGEIETLYHQMMRLARLPESWSLGDSQHTDDETDTVIKVSLEDKDLKFHRTVVEQELLSDIVDSWCVTKFDVVTKIQTTVETDMDKASAQMVAKRLSVEDPESIYTASVLQTIEEKRVEVCPLKAYQSGSVIGKVGKRFKQ